MQDFLSDNIVAAWQGSGPYAPEPPYDPSHSYPELPRPKRTSDSPNPAYEGVRQALHLLGLDRDNFDTASWNPLGELIQPGDAVLLKPNLIRESHAARPEEWEQVVTHGSVVRAVLDYVAIALRWQGRVIIADGPQTDSDFAALARRAGLDQVVAHFQELGLDVQLLDLRRDRWHERGDIIYRRDVLPGDPAGYVTVELGENSEFLSYGLNGKFYGADYNVDEVNSFHHDGRHAYVLCRSAVGADVVINLPKMKTHKKTGVTLSLKNLVGVNGYRNCLPHHTIGTPEQGGDEFPSSGVTYGLQSRGILAFKRALSALGGRGGGWARLVKRAGRAMFGSTDSVVRSGNWHGNDTTWRMVLDLNKAVLFFDAQGRIRERPLRYLSIVDGIVGGDGNGPSAPDAVPAGLIVAGGNPVAVDTVCTALMGFDHRRIRMLEHAWRVERLPLAAFTSDEVLCRSNRPQWEGKIECLEATPAHRFRPHFGWAGYIEKETTG